MDYSSTDASYAFEDHDNSTALRHAQINAENPLHDMGPTPMITVRTSAIVRRYREVAGVRQIRNQRVIC
ncbi:hypothetical protein ONZ45_g17027 [Pleurotus djamor]|nr:hypothetical protein ONZ45_g17027 [Pleurotus djamor]